MSGNSVQIKLQRFLLNYRTTPQGTTGIPPSQLLMGRQLRTRLDLVIPDLSKHVQDAQSNQKHYHDQHAKCRSFVAGDRVLVRNYSGSPNWLPGTVKTVLGPVSYQVEFTDGRLCKRHLDQLLKDNSAESGFDDHQADKDIIEFPLTETTSNSVTVENPVRHSSRVRWPPDRLTL